MTAKILYLHPSAGFGGSSKSLVELYKAFPPGEVEGYVLCPRGQTAEVFRSAGMKTIEVVGLPQWDETFYGHYRGARWIVPLRELFYLLPALIGLRRARKYGPFDVIHANEITVAYLGGIAKRWLNAPLAVHVRCLMRGDDGGRRTRHLERFLAHHADAVVAIDEGVRRTLPLALNVKVVHNGINIENFPPGGDRTGRRFRVAIIGVLNRAKGVYEFAEAARLCIDRGLDAEFWVIGKNVYDLKGFRGWLLMAAGFAFDFRKDLEEFIARHNLSNRLILKGFVPDVRKIYPNIDLLCFATHLNAPGRPVFEAACFRLPSVVAVKHPTPDTIRPGITGLCIDRPDPVLIADAIEYIYSHPDEARRMGEAGYRLAEEVSDINRNAQRMIGIYRRLCEKKRQS